MSEDFLHHIWKFRLFDQLGLASTLGEEIEIVHPGMHNTDSGPDFFNARIKIAGTLWAGNVEVHINASDWNKHGHQSDKAYQNIILHVVHNADIILRRANGDPLPTLQLKNLFSSRHYENYLRFKSSNDWIPCERQITGTPPLVMDSTLDRLLIERLERKSEAIYGSLALNHNNWEETFYQLLARNFGFMTNAVPFELMAKSLPLVVLLRHKNNLLQVEALLFGQAGMLERHLEDQYARALQNEYVFLKHKFKLQAIDMHLWKFLRLRPVNFPTIRIAQFASLIYCSANLFSHVLACEDIHELQELLDVSPSQYWETHYSFDKPAPQRKKSLGQQAINSLLINTVVPFLFVYGQQRGEEQFKDRALRIMELLPGEQNSIIEHWAELGIPVDTAYHTQALLQLKNEYCQQRQCLNCNIGNYLLKNS
jgi:hypothetical protein